MIKSKIITITKENQFDKGWTLFQPYDLKVNKNSFYKPVIMNDVIRLITFATNINLILSEPCLSSRVVAEIEWANKYLKINIIAKNQDVVDRYKKLQFNSIIIDNDVDFNYIGIRGKQDGFYIIGESFMQIDDSFEKAYFEHANLANDYTFLNKVERMIIVDSLGDKDCSKLIEEAKKAKKQINYVINTASFNRNIFDEFKNQGINLLISEKTKDGIILINQDGSLSCLTCGKDGFFVTYPIENINFYTGSLYKSPLCDDFIQTGVLAEDAYSCINGKLNKLNIIDTKLVPITIELDSIGDFVLGKFDSSIVENHNDYSLEAKKVEYQFKLIPPSLSDGYVESKLYDVMHSLSLEWKDGQTLKVKEIKEDYSTFCEKDFGLIQLLDESSNYTNKLLKMVERCRYKGFYQLTKSILGLFETTNKSLLNVFKEIYESLNEKNSVLKFDKFDNEIEGYRQTISEKNMLIEKGQDVLNNKRRVEILAKKINNLLELKKKFEGSSSVRNDKNSSEFVSKCEKLLNDCKDNVADDSIYNVIQRKEESKISKLESFADKYLVSIKKYLETSIVILNELNNVHIPEDYEVYDFDGKRFITIDSIEEYEATKALCAEFDLKCVVKEVFE